ncbi:MAG: hypothetical protein LBL96_07620 [Clostridiales bacterium]|nr:hypothetical protein [Clostridiales bacterium]
MFVVEGEKDVETVKKCGLPAVCSPHGAGTGKSKGKWKSAYNTLFTGKRVYILPDNDPVNDPVGYQFAEIERSNIAQTAASVQILDLLKVYPALPDKGDISDIYAAVGKDKTLISDIYAAVGKDKTLELLRQAQTLPPPAQCVNYSTSGADLQQLLPVKHEQDGRDWVDNPPPPTGNGCRGQSCTVRGRRSGHISVG